MTDPGALLAALHAAAADLPDTDSTTAADGMTVWVRAGTRFVALRRDTVELRVGPAIAAAAMRTPDTTGSNQGPDWIDFAPPILDGHALDRLDAWFAAAHRRAAG